MKRDKLQYRERPAIFTKSLVFIVDGRNNSFHQVAVCACRRVNSQVVQHVGHVSSVVQSVPVRLLGLHHLALVLQNVTQVSPSCVDGRDVSFKVIQVLSSGGGGLR